MDEIWNAIRAMKGKSGGKGKGFQGNCERCGKCCQKAKECRAPMPVREVEEEEKSEIDWACMMDEEPQELNAADEEKQVQEDEFDIKGLSDRAKKQVEERKKKCHQIPCNQIHRKQQQLAEGALQVTQWPQAKGKGLSQSGERTSMAAIE